MHPALDILPVFAGSPCVLRQGILPRQIELFHRIVERTPFGKTRRINQVQGRVLIKVLFQPTIHVAVKHEFPHKIHRKGDQRHQ